MCTLIWILFDEDHQNLKTKQIVMALQLLKYSNGITAVAGFRTYMHR